MTTGRRAAHWLQPLVCVALALMGIRGAALAAAALAPRVANYRISAIYDGATHTITAQEHLAWENTAHQAAPDLYFHLYLNAFANSQSTFVHETGETWVDWIRAHPHGWGYMQVKSIRIGGTELGDRLQFVHPDDVNIDDRTVARVPLDTPVGPGETVDVDIEFVTKLPKVVARSGYAGPFAFVAQWFPKIGVYTDDGWNCHQYHLTSEFFADFGVYDVTLTVPHDGVVGAAGTLREEHDNHNGTKTLRFVAEDVHDFAWTIDPRYRVIDDDRDSPHIRLLLQPNHLDQAPRHLQAARAAVTRYRDWIGAYPYPQLTIVDPGPGGGGAGGMEYPTLITAGTAWWMPLGIRFPEAVTVHEFGHQYWYGMVASNEFEEAWLDEGINSWVEGEIMDEVYGAASYLDLFGLRFNSTTLRRLRYVAAAQHDPMTRAAWKFLDRGSYGAVTYSKTALVLDTLDAYLGGDRLRQALASYFTRWRFRHPSGGDFLAALNESTGQDLTWYADQLVTGTGVLDYAVTRVESDEAHAFQGYHLAPGDVGPEVGAAESTEKRYRSEVVVERLGSVRMPVAVQIVFEDGTQSHEQWDGRDRWKRFEFTGAQRVEWAVVDPGNTMPVDVNRLNNSRMREAGTRGIIRIAGRWALWYESLLAFLGGL